METTRFVAYAVEDYMAAQVHHGDYGIRNRIAPFVGHRAVMARLRLAVQRCRRKDHSRKYTQKLFHILEFNNLQTLKLANLVFIRNCRKAKYLTMGIRISNM